MLQMTAKEREIHIQNREIIYKSYFKAYLQNRYSICNLIKRQIMEYFKWTKDVDGHVCKEHIEMVNKHMDHV